MKQEVADLWSYVGKVDAICVTTNGIVDKKGRAIMGGGCAKEAADRWASVPVVLGKLIEQYGNQPHLIGFVMPPPGPAAFVFPNKVMFGINEVQKVKNEYPGSTMLFSFPTKSHWKNPSTYSLIQFSALWMVKWVKDLDLKSVVIPRPGCGLGNLRWEDVRPMLQTVLDDRFTVVTNKE